ncbi:MAG: L-threonylcarbamoyladenylate synthase [Candidatus Aenigmatarchaeota archaeon]
MQSCIISIKSKKAIPEAIRILKKGETIIYPSESSYAIGADANNSRAIRKVRILKHQSTSKPIAVIIDSEHTATKIAKINHIARRIVNQLMPGRITIICDKKQSVPGILNKKEISFRIPSDSFSQSLVKEFKKPITATSANIHGEPAIYRINDIQKRFGNRVHLILDAGNLKKRRPSTIFDTKTMKILRQGPVSEKKIWKTIKK